VVSEFSTPPATADAVRSAAAAALRAGPGVLLTGPAGIGKSHLAALLLDAESAGALVLRCAPVEAELPLPFMCLIDLLEPVGDADLDRLPAGQRAALRAALLRGDEADGGSGGAAGGTGVHLAVLTLLRGFAARGPVWIVCDDLQWMDEPTAQILGFVARRAAGLPLRFLATERVGAGHAALHAGLLPADTVQLAVPPLSPADLGPLLERSAGAPVPPSTVREIHRVAQGNPLYAVEILRALPAGARAPHGGSMADLPVPGLLRSLLLDRLRTLPDAVRDSLVLASAADRPDLTLLATAGGEAAATHLETAEKLGIVRIGPDGQVQFEHPLVRAAVYSEASGRARREAHARLADTATEPVERARHLALANPAQDEGVAALLMAAAASARRRGAPATAAELAALAVARTPAHAPAERADRQLAQAGYCYASGRWDEARRLAAEVLAEAADPPVRGQARIVLLQCAGQALETEGRLIEDGLAEAVAADATALEAQLRVWASDRHYLAGRVGEAAGEARRAAALAERAGDSLGQVMALTSLAYLERAAGDREAEHTLAAALETARRSGIDDVRLWETLITQVIFGLHDNRLAAAEEQMLAALDRFGDQISIEDAMHAYVKLTDVRLRAGDCPGALRAASRANTLYEDVDGSAGPVVYALAAAESYGGSLRRARELAERGVQVAERDGDHFWAMWNRTVLGRVHLLADEPIRAAAVLRDVRRAERTMGIADPAVGRWHADLAEALVGSGALEEAAEFIAAVQAAAVRLGRAEIAASLQRAAALRELALGRVAPAAELLEDSVETLRRARVPLELARSLVVLADVERRRRRQAAARRATDEAVRICRAAGAAAWLDRVEQRSRRAVERAREAEAGALTPSELRIATLAADGATNREIAAACYLSVKTVEASLSRVYRKLGVRSRTELAKTLQDRGNAPVTL
jgi:DNA-binding CsgD family transcriptional regulator